MYIYKPESMFPTYSTSTRIATMQGQLNSLKVVGAQLTNNTHFYCEKLNSNEHLQILWGKCLQCPSLVLPPMLSCKYYNTTSFIVYTTLGM